MAIDPSKQLPGGPGTVNEEFLDALVRHQIHLLRLNGTIRNKIIKILDDTERDLAGQIRERLRTVTGDGVTPRSLARLRVLEGVVRQLRAKAWRDITEEWVQQLRELAASEPEFVANALRVVSPVQLDLALPSPQLLQAIVTTYPFEGKTMRQWASSIQRTDLERIMSAIRVGMVQGESAPQIARRVVGSARLRGVNGVTEITRRNAAAITRTAVNAISNAAKRAFYEENRDVVEKELYVATLDASTTPICRSLDGEEFPVGEGPIPPLHFNCRSLRVALVTPEPLGRRPFKRSTERQLLREFSKESNLSRVPRRRADIPYGFKGAFDEFARARIRELTGTVPAKISYQQWLSRQSKMFQDDVLGPTRGRLFRDGNLTLDKFVNRAGDELTLSELAQREAAAFRAAGLDPDDF